MSELSPSRILVADDREENRYVLCRVLIGAGYQCSEAATGTMALELAETQPDLIILDVRLPDISGYEVRRRIKASPRTASIPILQISAAFVAPEDRVRALEAGADGYLTHPIDRMVLVATVRALLRLRMAESKARGAAQQWQATFDTLAEGLAILDGSDRLLRWNGAFETICGSAFQPAIGENPVAFFSGLSGDQQWVHRHAGIGGEILVGSRSVHISINSIAGESSKGEKVMLLSDITDRKLAEYAMRTAEKLAATGKLANAMAHEINNPLEAITNLLYLARSTDEVQDIQQHLERASSELERISRITRQTLSFHRDTQRPVLINLAELIADVIALYERIALAKQVRLKFDVQTTPRIHGFPGQLTQVFANLLRNAIDASPASSEVTVRLRPLFGGKCASIVVHDRGPGIPITVREKMFDPFFTTKELKGSGLGLWVSRRIIAEHAGVIRFRSSECPGTSGTSFAVFLPAEQVAKKISA